MIFRTSRIHLGINFFILFVIDYSSAESLCRNVIDEEEIYHYCSDNARIEEVSDCSGTTQCGNWCEGDNVSFKVLNSDIGMVLFYIPPSPSCCRHTSFSVHLGIYKNTSSNEENNYISPLVHSKHDISCDKVNMTSKTMEVQFMYVFSGYYQLEIRPWDRRNSRLPCSTRSFEIETSYNKRLLVDHDPVVNIQCREPSELLISLNDGGGIEMAQWIKHVKIEVYPSGCGIEDFTEEVLSKAKILNSGLSEDQCCENGYKSSCSCQWDSNRLLCSFRIVSAGNYCIHLTLIDDRCIEGTLWVPDTQKTTACQWHIPHMCSPRGEISPVVLYSVNYNEWLYIALTISFIVSIVGIIIYCKTSPKTLYNRYVSFVAMSPKVVLTEKKERVLLLYPRDCTEFMDVMAKFRKCLSNSLNTQVFDLWDPDVWDEVAENGFSWSRNLISEPDVKIILVATQSSRLIEKALLKGNEIVYFKRDAFDHYFPATFKSIFECFVLDSYKRIFVTRIDGEHCDDDKFIHLNPFSVYTIPQHLHSLTSEIKNSDTSEEASYIENEEKLLLLIAAIKTYNTYRSLNPNYLDQILHISEKNSYCDR